MNMKFKPTKMAAALAGAAILVLAGCGGGGGTPPATTLSGTVAGGAAVVGNVIVTDSKGATKSAPIGTAGQYSIDVSGMTGPFLLKASGTVGNTSVTYYSAATSADFGGTVNVTPFTDLIVSNIAAQLAVNYFSDPAKLATIGTLITPANLAAAETALQAKLQPVLNALGLGASVDLLHQAFTADHTGLDAMLDLVKVTTNTSTNIATFTNAITKGVIGTDNAQEPDGTPVSDVTGINPSTATDLQTVVAKLNAFAALFASGLPSQTTLENSGLFDISSNFMMGGQTFAEFVNEISNNPSNIGMKFSNVDIALDPSGNSGGLTTTMSSNSRGYADVIQIKMVKDATKGWLVEGDGRIADVSMRAKAQLDQWADAQSSTFTTANSILTNGIEMYVDAHNYNSHSTTSAPAVTAVVTGPGLPSGGITMTQDTQNTHFDVDGYGGSGNNLIPECGTQANTTTGPILAQTQCVTVANALDNSIYTVVLKDGSGNPLNGSGYQVTLRKQPCKWSDLSAAMLPNISSVTVNGADISITNLVAKAPVAIAWIMPTGLEVSNVNLWGNTANGAYFSQSVNVLGTATQTVIPLPDWLISTPIFAGVSVEGTDVYGRRFANSKSVQFQQTPQ